MPFLLVMSVRGAVYILYRMGPSTEPSGTSQKSFQFDNCSELILQTWFHQLDTTRSKLVPFQFFQSDVLVYQWECHENPSV